MTRRTMAGMMVVGIAGVALAGCQSPLSLAPAGRGEGGCVSHESPEGLWVSYEIGRAHV